MHWKTVSSIQFKIVTDYQLRTAALGVCERDLLFLFLFLIFSSNDALLCFLVSTLRATIPPNSFHNVKACLHTDHHVGGTEQLRTQHISAVMSCLGNALICDSKHIRFAEASHGRERGECNPMGQRTAVVCVGELESLTVSWLYWGN